MAGSFDQLLANCLATQAATQAATECANLTRWVRDLNDSFLSLQTKNQECNLNLNLSLRNYTNLWQECYNLSLPNDTNSLAYDTNSSWRDYEKALENALDGATTAGRVAAWMLLLLPPLCCLIGLMNSETLRRVLAVHLDFTGVFFLGVWWTMFLLTLYDSDPMIGIRGSPYWPNFLGIFGVGYTMVILANVGSLLRRTRRKLGWGLEVTQLVLSLFVGMVLAVHLGMMQTKPSHRISYLWYLLFIAIFSVIALLSLLRVSQAEMQMEAIQTTQSEVAMLLEESKELGVWGTHSDIDDDEVKIEAPPRHTIDDDDET
eukprot:TRINITY_DN17523_c0_g1_i1.p1 TRINITY_DN17523_c0_g1~~TRINITY_DN17523_c0_g1_i1.p1  ORF type:complete len:317 (-),score=65.46 TRINITY_DN17523_c0_g1_i1:277-1227(-)